MDSSQGGAVDASSAPAGRTETVGTMGSSQGAVVVASSVPAGRAESDSGASAAFGRAAHEPSCWGRLPPTVRGRTRGQSQMLKAS